MAKVLQHRRDTTANLSSVSGAIGEFFMDTTKNTLVVMDGSTNGGHPLATESYVDTSINNLIGGAPGALDTLNELAAAINDDANAYTTLSNSIAAKQDTLVSGTSIKTVNGTSLLGSGDITISGGSGGSSDPLKQAIAGTDILAGWPVVFSDAFGTTFTVDAASSTGEYETITSQVNAATAPDFASGASADSNYDSAIKGQKFLLNRAVNANGRPALLGGTFTSTKIIDHKDQFEIPNSANFSFYSKIISVPSSATKFIITYKHTNGTPYWGIADVATDGTVTILNTGQIVNTLNIGIQSMSLALSFDESTLLIAYVSSNTARISKFTVDMGTNTLTLQTSKVINPSLTPIFKTYLVARSSGLFELGTTDGTDNNNYLNTIGGGTGEIWYSNYTTLSATLRSLISNSSSLATKECIALYGSTLASIDSGTPNSTDGNGAEPTESTTSPFDYKFTPTNPKIVFNPVNPDELLATYQYNGKFYYQRFGVYFWGFSLQYGDSQVGFNPPYYIAEPGPILPVADSTNLLYVVSFVVDGSYQGQYVLIDGPFTTNITTLLIGFSKTAALAGQNVDLAMIGDVVTLHEDLRPASGSLDKYTAHIQYDGKINTQGDGIYLVGRMVNSTDLAIGTLIPSSADESMEGGTT